jgi:hypothetical protein
MRDECQTGQRADHRDLSFSPGWGWDLIFKVEFDPVWWTSSERNLSKMGISQSATSATEFTDEFMAEAVRLVLEEGRTVGDVAREPGLAVSLCARDPRPSQLQILLRPERR